MEPEGKYTPDGDNEEFAPIVLTEVVEDGGKEAAEDTRGSTILREERPQDSFAGDSFFVEEGGGQQHSSPGSGSLLNAVRSGTVVEGRLSFDEAVCIEGTLLGSLKSRNVLVVGRDAEVEGDIEAYRVVVAGTVRGNIHAVDTIEIRCGAYVRGEIYAGELVVEKGATVAGPLIIS